MRKSIAAAVLVSGLAAATVVAPTASASPACTTSPVRTLIPAPVPVLSWVENLGYDKAGNLWVSRVQQNVVERYDSRGRKTGTVRVDAPGAVRLGPDRRMYVTSGDTTINMIPGLPLRGRIVSFDPTATKPAARTVARGLGMPNGMAITRDGTMYVADSNLGVVKVRKDGSIDRSWTVRAPKNLAPNTTVNGTGMNGIAISGGVAYVTMTQSLTGRVLRVPLDDPSKVSKAADLTSPFPGIVDDIALVGDRTIAAATTTGRLIVVDLPTGARCSVNAKRPVTAVALTPDERSLVLGSEDGTVSILTPSSGRRG
jgi:sugar lactone lactonase YvrE